MREHVTKAFASQALAFPDRVDQALAETDTVAGAKELLDKAGAMQHYAERLKAGVQIERPIAYGVLKIKAKLGELMPAGKGGRGKKHDNPVVGFSRPTISDYRKLAANRDRLELLGEAVIGSHHSVTPEGARETNRPGTSYSCGGCN